jgi:outer membrane receptor protein involved in Fe transport
MTTLTGGLRYDYVSSVNEGGFFGDQSVANSAAAGFGAVTVRPHQHVTVTGQVSRGFRDPTLSDRFYRGPTGRGFITGNPDLDPEKSLQFDLSARYATSRLRVAGYLYHYRISDLVERFETEPDFFFFRNRGRARIRGVEFEAQADIGNGFWVEATAQVSRGLALDDDSALDDISPDTFGLTLRRAFAGRVMLFGRLSRYHEDDRPGPGEIKAPGHTNLDIGGSWYASDKVEIRGAVRNLLNEEYYASPDRRFVLAPGVNAFVTVAVSLR